MSRLKKVKTAVIKDGTSGNAKEVFSIVNGRKSDASIHEHWMEGVEEDYEYRRTSYDSAVADGMEKELAKRVFLLPEDLALLD